MHLTKDDIHISVKVLKELLANAHVLSVKTQNFHWNVEDMRFHMLHAFFSEQYTLLIDNIGEEKCLQNNKQQRNYNQSNSALSNNLKNI